MTNLIILSITLVTNRQDLGWTFQSEAFVHREIVIASQIVRIGFAERGISTNASATLPTQGQGTKDKGQTTNIVELGSFARPLWTNENRVRVPVGVMAVWTNGKAVTTDD